ncbi:MAG: hypothetical protein M1826_006541 [Phylliscum demangeonii]|nr:MAG: hypothetical protein M1826_006541 [Phylliscum demangeonii]
MAVMLKDLGFAHLLLPRKSFARFRDSSAGKASRPSLRLSIQCTGLAESIPESLPGGEDMPGSIDRPDRDPASAKPLPVLPAFSPLIMELPYSSWLLYEEFADPPHPEPDFSLGPPEQDLAATATPRTFDGPLPAIPRRSEESMTSASAAPSPLTSIASAETELSAVSDASETARPWTSRLSPHWKARERAASAPKIEMVEVNSEAKKAGRLFSCRMLEMETMLRHELDHQANLLQERERTISRLQHQLAKAGLAHDEELQTLHRELAEWKPTTARGRHMAEDDGSKRAHKAKRAGSKVRRDRTPVRRIRQQKDAQIAKLTEELMRWKAPWEGTLPLVEGVDEGPETGGELVLLSLQRPLAETEAEPDLSVSPLKIHRASVMAQREASVVARADIGLPCAKAATELLTVAQLSAARIQQLEEQCESQAEDIRLYKLDVKGYKKDVRKLEREIARLQQALQALQRTILDLQSRLSDPEGEVLLSEVPLTIDPAIQHPSAKSRPAADERAPEPPSTPPPPPPPKKELPAASTLRSPARVPASTTWPNTPPSTPPAPIRAALPTAPLSPMPRHHHLTRLDSFSSGSPQMRRSDLRRQVAPRYASIKEEEAFRPDSPTLAVTPWLTAPSAIIDAILMPTPPPSLSRPTATATATPRSPETSPSSAARPASNTSPVTPARSSSSSIRIRISTAPTSTSNDSGSGSTSAPLATASPMHLFWHQHEARSNFERSPLPASWMRRPKPAIQPAAVAVHSNPSPSPSPSPSHTGTGTGTGNSPGRFPSPPSLTRSSLSASSALSPLPLSQQRQRQQQQTPLAVVVQDRSHASSPGGGAGGAVVSPGGGGGPDGAEAAAGVGRG